MRKETIFKIITGVFLLSITNLSVADVKKKIVIGLSIPTQREERWLRDKNAMIEEAKKLGVELKVQISDTDVALQNLQCENLLSQGIDVLIMAPHDAYAAGTIVEKAHSEGVKVISYDRLIMNADVDIYLSFDNVKVGELQGEYITKKVSKGNYIIMTGAPTDNNAKLLKKGAMKYIQPLVTKGLIKVVADQAVDNWEPQNAITIVENALTKANNKVDAILAPNDGAAGGAIEALSSQGMAGKVFVTGQDAEVAAAKRIMMGTQAMTIFKDTRELGKRALQVAIQMVRKEKIKTDLTVNNNKVEVPSILLIPKVMTKDNIQELVKLGYIKAEALK